MEKKCKPLVMEKNYDYIMECVSENYYDHSSANARSNVDAVNILKIVESWGCWPDKDIEQQLLA